MWWCTVRQRDYERKENKTNYNLFVLQKILFWIEIRHTWIQHKKTRQLSLVLTVDRLNGLLNVHGTYYLCTREKNTHRKQREETNNYLSLEVVISAGKEQKMSSEYVMASQSRTLCASRVVWMFFGLALSRFMLHLLLL